MRPAPEDRRTAANLAPPSEADALRAATLCEAFQLTAASDPDAVALRTPGGRAQMSWREYADRVERIAGGLAALGVARGDAVALMMSNRPEFNLCDTAALHLGAAPFSIYNTLPVEDIAHLLSNAGSRVVICEGQFADRVLAAGARTGVEHVVYVDDGPQGTLPLAELERRRSPEFDFEAAWRAVEPDDVLTLIYTSGTTGPPKGVEITHATMLAQLRAASQVLPVVPGDRCLSYLPSAHIADRWLTHYPSLVFGAQVTCAADAAQLPAALVDTRPTTWGAVPRVWEKLMAALQAHIASERDPTRAAALRGAIEVGRRKVRAEQAANAGQGPGPDEGLLAEYEAADAAVLSKLRAKLGLDRVRWSVTGAAPTGIEVMELFGAIGIPICELLGMSEMSCVVTANPPGRIRFGTVGTPLPGIEVTLADDGELLCRGPTVMRGYRGEPDKTAEAIDPDGWLHSGDIAEIDPDGYVRIVDRKKELIINAAGKNMSPANIEAKLKAASPLIGQAVAIGDRRPYNVALIVLDPEACAAYAAAEGLPDGSVAALSRDPRVAAAVANAVERANQQLARVEQIKRYKILPDEWPAGGRELTPTMKLKRKPIADKYADEIDALYLRELPTPDADACGPVKACEVVGRADGAGLRLVRFLWCGSDGTVRAKASSVHGLEGRIGSGIGLTVAMQAMNALDQLQPVEGMGAVGEIRLVPDPETFRVLPYAPRTGAMLVDHMRHDGSPAPVCQRSFLRRMQERLAQRGARLEVAFENEFSLATEVDGAFVPIDSGLCFSTISATAAQDYLDELVGALEAQEIVLEQYYSELGHGQHEISTKHSPALRAADDQLLVRETIRGVAARCGLVASLAPKPWPENAGNGGHIHFSLWDVDTGVNRFHDAAAPDRLSAEARSFIAGVLAHLPGLCGLTAPSFNSYSRILPQQWAGAFACWGHDNREAPLRVPSVFWGMEEASTNVELKAADASSNPYLAVGGLIAAGLDGLERGLEPPSPIDVDPATLDEQERAQRGIVRLPTTQEEALNALQVDELLTGALGPVLSEAYLAVRRSEWEAYSAGDEAFEQQGHFSKY